MNRVKLIATEGMILTNGELYGRVVYLGTGESPDNWQEISETEYETLLAQEAATEADYQAALRELGVQV